MGQESLAFGIGRPAKGCGERTAVPVAKYGTADPERKPGGGMNRRNLQIFVVNVRQAILAEYY